MSYKTLKSPIKEFPGTVEFPDYLTLPQFSKYSDASLSAIGKSAFTHAMIMLPVQKELTGDWNIEGFPKERDFSVEPFKPILPLLQFMGWLHKEFMKMVTGADEIPNA